MEFIQKQTPSWSENWKLILVVSLAVYCIAATMRLQEFPKWDHPDLRVGDEYVMATHDAYRWLAEAQDTSLERIQPQSRLTRGLAAISGANLGDVGFWSPAFLAPLVAVAVVLWAFTLGAAEAGLCAGILAALAPGYYLRTRLGYYDTDLVTLLFPILVSWAVAHWCRPFLKPSWLGVARLWSRNTADIGEEDAKAGQASPEQGAGWRGTASLAWMLAAGLAASGFGTWHVYIDVFNGVVLCLGIVLSLLLGRRGLRTHLLTGLAVYGSAAFLGRLGFVLAACALALPLVPGRGAWKWLRSPVPALLLLVFVFVQAGTMQSMWMRAHSFVNSYIKPQAEQVLDTAAIAPKDRVVYPAIGQSIIEAKNLDFGKWLKRFHLRDLVTYAGLAGCLVLLVLRPVFLFLAPLLVLSLLAGAFGSRTSMFGAPPLALGVGMLAYGIVYWLLPRGRIQGWTRWLRWCAPPALVAAMALLAVSAFGLKANLGGPVPIFAATLLAGWAVIERPAREWRFPLLCCMAVVGILCTWDAMKWYPRYPPTPVLRSPHAEALRALGREAEDPAMVWTWWDWGYATHYYAGLPSFADGGRHGGDLVFPLGFVMTTTNPSAANDIIHFSAANQYAPARVWNALDSAGMAEFVRGLGQENTNREPLTEKQYLVVTEEAVTLFPWISFYGSWDFMRKTSHKGDLTIYADKPSVDMENGALLYPEFKQLKSVTLVDGNASWESVEFDNPGGKHLVYLPFKRTTYLMSRAMYESVMVRLLFDDPEAPDLRENFRLVYDGYPRVRVYEVR